MPDCGPQGFFCVNYTRPGATVEIRFGADVDRDGFLALLDALRAGEGDRYWNEPLYPLAFVLQRCGWRRSEARERGILVVFCDTDEGECVNEAFALSPVPARRL